MEQLAVYSGDTTHRLTKLISVSATLKLYVGTAESASKVGWKGTFDTDSGSFAASVRSSATVSPGKWGKVTATWDVTQFTASAFAGINNFKSDANYGNANTNFAKSSGYLYITIVFESDEYFPAIDSYSGSRFNGTKPDDLGMQFAYSFKLSSRMVTQEATAEYPSYINLSIGDNVIKTIADTQSGATMAQINNLIGSSQSGVITDPPFSIGSGYNITLNFCYHGELVQQTVYIGKSFVNFHFSGARKSNGDEVGGVAIGKYSSVVSNGIPKFECDYQAYFYNGIANFIPVSLTKNVSGSNTLKNTELSYTIPANSFYVLTARASYTNSKPASVLFSTRSDSAKNGVVSEAVSANYIATTTVSGFTESEMTLYVWAKWSGSGSEHVDINGFVFACNAS